MSDDRVELKPCPFCGKIPTIVCPDDSYGSAMVTCGDRNECPVDVTSWADLKAGETLTDAIAAWNQRDPSIESLQAEVERYRQALVLLSSSFETGWASRLNDRAAVIGRVEGIARQALAAKEQTR